MVKKPNKKERLFEITVRYICLLICAAFMLPLLYKIFTPLTIFFSATLLKVFYQVTIADTIIALNATTLVQIIPACVAGSAYLLLVLLNLSLPLSFKQRFLSLLFGFSLFFLANILRIVILAILYYHKSLFFNSIHLTLWYLASTLLVIGIWILTVYVFAIKNIPLYTDVTYLVKMTRSK